jgi:hypothetical protein
VSKTSTVLGSYKRYTSWLELETCCANLKPFANKICFHSSFFIFFFQIKIIYIYIYMCVCVWIVLRKQRCCEWRQWQGNLMPWVKRERKDMIEKEIERNKGKKVCANFNLIGCTSLTFTSCTTVLSWKISFQIY